jgi:hypothetical protein
VRHAGVERASQRTKHELGSIEEAPLFVRDGEPLAPRPERHATEVATLRRSHENTCAARDCAAMHARLAALTF